MRNERLMEGLSGFGFAAELLDLALEQQVFGLVVGDLGSIVQARGDKIACGQEHGPNEQPEHAGPIQGQHRIIADPELPENQEADDSQHSAGLHAAAILPAKELVVPLRQAAMIRFAPSLDMPAEEDQ